MDASTMWRVRANDNERFPVRISLLQDGRESLVLLAQARWPGPGRQVFCLRETEPPEQLGEVLEEVPVASMRRFGAKLSIVLERNRHKRCDFLFLKRAYKHQPGEYEQIFFRTASSLRQHKAKGRTNLFGEVPIEVVIDTRERYPWKFGEGRVRRADLPAGDYALIHDHRPAAIVERKSFEGLLSDIGKLQLLHQQLAELAAWPHAAMVIEAHYGDFLDPERTGKWSAAHLGRVLAELTTLHPELPIIFAGNRKYANQWALGFFEAVARKLTEPASGQVAEVTAAYRQAAAGGGDEQKLRYLIAQEMPESFSIRELQARLPSVKRERLRTLLGRLRDEGLLERVGHGKAARWCKRDRDRNGNGNGVDEGE